MADLAQPLGAPGSGTNTSIAAQLSRLLVIDIRKARSIPLLGAMIVVALVIVRDSLTPGVALWSELNVAGARSVWIIGPLSAGFSAWQASRGNRSPADLELVTPLPLPAWVSDFSRLLAAMYWSLLAYLVVLVIVEAWGIWQATWGGPWLDLWFAAGCVIVASVAGGFLVGRTWRSRLAPLMAAIAAFVVPSLVLEAIPRLELVSVQSIAVWRHGSLWTTGSWSVALYIGAFWLTLAMLNIAVLRFMRGRGRLWKGATFLAVLLLLVIGAGAVLSYHSVTEDKAQREGKVPVLLQPVPLECATVHSTEVCVHPAYRAVHDDLVADIEPVLGLFGGLPGVPARFVQYNDYAAWNIPFSHIQYRSPEWDGLTAYLQVVDAIFPAADTWRAPQAPGRFTAAQLVILAAINPEPNRQSRQGDAPLDVMPGNIVVSSVPREMVGGQDASAFANMDSNHTGAALNAEMRAAAERFASLSPEEQRAWLEANWDSLRAGELTLEDLP